MWRIATSDRRAENGPLFSRRSSRPWRLGRQRETALVRAAVFCLMFTAAFWLGRVPSAQAGPTDRAKQRANEALSDVQAAAAGLKVAVIGAKKSSPEALVAAADLHLRTGHFDSAIDTLSLVVELHRQGKASASNDADAQFMLGESYFKTGQLYSAKRHFEVVTDRAEQPSYLLLGGPAASRLVDIALLIQRQEDLPDVLARVDRLLSRSSNEALHYARAKALFAMGRYQESRSQASGINSSGLYGQKSAYLRGAALMKEAAAVALADAQRPLPDYRAAVAAFEQAIVPGSGAADQAEDSRRITELSWLAVARLHYETQNFARSAVAYEKVPRSSEYFPQALFELSWTYVRLGEFDRAQRSLEALSVLDPGLVDGADAELLRGDLLLRAGKFEEAQEAYEFVRNKYDPLRQQVTTYIENHRDAAIYYDKLTAASIETGTELPSLAVDWAREEAEEDRVFAIVDDVARSRSLIKRARRMVTLLRASLASSASAKIFPEVEKGLQQTVALLNQLGIARLSLARGMDSVAGTASAQLAAVRKKRRSLMSRLGEIPTNPGDFSVRNAQSDDNWNRLSQQLQRLQLEADHLRALVNGLHRVVNDSARHGLTADAATLERYGQEIVENEKDLVVYFERIDALREQLEMGRIQSGFGDERFVEDDRVRDEFSKLFASESQLASRGGDSKAASYSQSILPILSNIGVLESRLRGLRAQLDAQVSSAAEDMQVVIDTEERNIEVYASRLDTMDQHARLLVGEVARSNFIKARDRIKDVVMRADVGLVQQAWEVREEQRHRVRDLLRERAQEERLINDELREVLDDAEEQ